MIRPRIAALALWAGALYCLAPASAAAPAGAPRHAEVQAPAPGAAQSGRGVLFNCRTLAQAVGGVAVYRDVGADQAKTIAMLRAKNAWLGGSHLQALEREIRRMWREGLTPEEAEFALYKRCEAQLGDMGREG